VRGVRGYQDDSVVQPTGKIYRWHMRFRTRPKSDVEHPFPYKVFIQPVPKGFLHVTSVLVTLQFPLNKKI
jgi:hypothetical protein